MLLLFFLLLLLPLFKIYLFTPCLPNTISFFFFLTTKLQWISHKKSKKTRAPVLLARKFPSFQASNNKSAFMIIQGNEIALAAHIWPTLCHFFRWRSQIETTQTQIHLELGLTTTKTIQRSTLVRTHFDDSSYRFFLKFLEISYSKFGLLMMNDLFTVANSMRGFLHFPAYST